MDSAIPTPSIPPHANPPPLALVVMGVSGCGKSSAAAAVAQQLGWQLVEGDSYHAPESVAKMNAGTPLTDADRAGWLQRLALKRRYRDQLRAAQPRLGFVFLDLDYATALARVQTRAGHFFSPELVANQFATLEDPRAEPDVLTLPATMALPDIAARVQQWLAR